ncbi:MULTISPECIES: glycosyltransferase [Lactobacillaceae]|uniref:glycosyltransferase n=1 Tax=Lactobacillaceae TaxID=33958 RepID=UPI0008A154BC|nr:MULTISPECIES: glycosyltransferase [Lactobacillaceae]MDT8952614.1 glycosyltransferase [Lacticaseibacillus paracasei subsp. paracasei]OFP89917.1 hypothetical protein HMPREF2969_02420 [Lactobacillus sp. HMSC056D05]WRM19142.1 glycosyltransferase [Lacticaseibacillus paracasei]
MHVAVLMSTFNGERFLEAQLESIWKQKTEAQIHLYVRDDGSTDSTLKILHAWSTRIPMTIVQDHENIGPSRSFFRLARGVSSSDYYAFVDQDDIWDLNKLETCIQAMECKSTPVVCTSNCRIIDSQGLLIRPRMHAMAPKFTIPSQLTCGSVQGCSMVFNNSALSTFIKWDDRKVPMHDLALLVGVMSMGGEIIYFDKALFSYRVHNRNVVAKQGKTFLVREKNTLEKWIGRKNLHDISIFADEIIRIFGSNLDEGVCSYLHTLSQCPSSLRARVKVLFNHESRSPNFRGDASFRIKVLLGTI